VETWKLLEAVEAVEEPGLVVVEPVEEPGLVVFELDDKCVLEHPPNPKVAAARKAPSSNNRPAVMANARRVVRSATRMTPRVGDAGGAPHHPSRVADVPPNPSGRFS
jgi:hypothetical protein